MFGFMAICRPMSSHFMKLFQEKNLSCNKVFLTFVKDTELAQENVVQIFFFFLIDTDCLMDEPLKQLWVWSPNFTGKSKMPAGKEPASGHQWSLSSLWGAAVQGSVCSDFRLRLSRFLSSSPNFFFYSATQNSSRMHYCFFCFFHFL